MYLEPNNPSLSFAEFLEAAVRDKAKKLPFPYTLEVCKCRYCSFCQNGKCALKRCCCMSERVKAKTCTFATFDESKANALRAVFLDMHDLTLMSETHTRHETRQEPDANGNMVEATEVINTVYVTVITTPKSAAQIAEEYGFTAQQKEMLTELLSSENAELWISLLS